MMAALLRLAQQLLNRRLVGRRLMYARLDGDSLQCTRRKHTIAGNLRPQEVGQPMLRCAFAEIGVFDAQFYLRA
ncbi:MAG: hypothetical protein DMG57_34715 [Acidobacteria bacterium]|nr:MAG: hypothetical protein DMG57_34715 [Acidobacteriota bacterium]